MGRSGCAAHSASLFPRIVDVYNGAVTRPLELEFRSTGRFEVVRRLGEGGMGVVYEAYDRERQSRVALKTLRTLSAEGILRFKNEFRALQDLTHPNLCGLGELISDGGQWFFTMELIDGVDLLSWVRPGVHRGVPATAGLSEMHDTQVELQERTFSDGPQQWLNQSALGPSPSADTLRAATTQRRLDRLDRAGRPPLDVARLRAALLSLGRAVSALHAAGVVHRDIKPTNVLVDGNGRVVLLDFGLATSGARPGESDVRVVGTADYMAPEQASGRKVGPEADWYSVGVVLYEALTGGVPFAGAPLEVLLQKQGREPLPPRALAQETPPDLDALCVGLLRRDPRERYGAKKLIERLGRDVPVELHAPAAPREAHFVGRSAELAALEAAYERARAGNGVTVHIRGESGVGKSALARQFVTRLRAVEPQLLVLQGRCYERESVPYKAVDGVIDALSRLLNKLPKSEVEVLIPARAGLLAEAFPVLRRVEAVAQAPRPNEAVDPMLLRRRLFTALRELLNNLAARAPLVIVIDDLQWADADSLALLDALTRPPAAPPFLLLATVRMGGDDAPAQRASPLLAPEARVVNLARLSPTEARTLAVELLHDAGDPLTGEGSERTAQAIAEEARGHPLFIDELVRHAVAAREVHSAPMHVEDALWERFERLEPQAQRLLELVAIAGGPLVQQAAARAAEMELGQFVQQAATLRAANLVRTTGARASDLIEPYHDRVRAAIQSHRSPADIKRAHERLALGLEAIGRADPEALAAHWRGAGDNDKAAAYAVQAAERASKALAFDRAAQLYRQTLLLYPTGSAEVPKLQMRLGDALAFTGRGAEAARAYLAAAERVEPADAIELRRRASEQLLRSGHVDDGMAALAPVLAANRLRVPATARGALASLLYRRARVSLRGLRFHRRDAAAVPPALLARIDTAWSLAIGLGNVDTLRASDFAARQLLLALDAGEPSRIARALALESCFWAIQGTAGAARATELLLLARTLAEEVDNAQAIGLTIASGAIVKHMAGQWRDGIALFAEAEQVFRERCRAVNWELATSQILRLHGVVQLGEMSELAKATTEYLQEAEQRGDLYAATLLRLGLLNIMWLVEDLPTEARQECEDAIAHWSNRGFHTQHADYQWALTQIDLYLGNGEAAWQRVRQVWPELERAHMLRLQVVSVGNHDLRGRAAIAAAAKAGGDERARRLRDARESARHIEQQGTPWGQPLATLIRAGVANLEGDRGRTVALLDAAAAAFDELEMAMHASIARGRQGRIVGGDAGRALVAALDKWCAAQHVRDPRRFADVIAPGYDNG
jgi:serine/threonine protein kinase